MTHTPPPRSSGVPWRAIVSVLETVAYIAGAVQAAMGNGNDVRNAFVTVLSGLVMHGINHNAGGSPI